jgi:hypothetical protein
VSDTTCSLNRVIVTWCAEDSVLFPLYGCRLPLSCYRGLKGHSTVDMKLIMNVNFMQSMCNVDPNGVVLH